MVRIKLWISETRTTDVCIFNFDQFFVVCFLSLSMTVTNLFTSASDRYTDRPSSLLLLLLPLIFSLSSVNSVWPTWAASWLYPPVRAIGTGPSPRTPLRLAGTLILPTGTVPRAGRGGTDVCPTPAAFTPCTGAAKVR